MLQAVVTRASKLAAKSSISNDIIDPSTFVDKSLFEKVCESEMFNVLEKLKPIAMNCDRVKYKLLAEGLVSSSETLANFFDGGFETFFFLFHIFLWILLSSLNVVLIKLT